jgi:hypothetical protein
MADMPQSSMIVGCVAPERVPVPRDREIGTSHKIGDVT